MTIPSQPTGAKRYDNILNTQFGTKCGRGHVIPRFYSTYPSNHTPLISSQSLHVFVPRAPGFAAMQQCRTHASSEQFPSSLERDVPRSKNRKKSLEFSPSGATPSNDGEVATSPSVQHVS